MIVHQLFSFIFLLGIFRVQAGLLKEVKSHHLNDLFAWFDENHPEASTFEDYSQILDDIAKKFPKVSNRQNQQEICISLKVIYNHLWEVYAGNGLANGGDVAARQVVTLAEDLFNKLPGLDAKITLKLAQGEI